MNEKIIRVIRSALGSDIHRFTIRFDELLDDNVDYYSATFSFNPKQIENAEFKVTGGKHCLQFDVCDGEVFLVFGEDDQVAVSALNIYKILYWSEATESID